MHKNWLSAIGKVWRKLRESSQFRSILTYTVFVGIAAMFWIILTLNESVQDGCIVNVKITNKPDTITFISDVPKTIHVEVRDKGSSLMRTMWMHKPTLNLNFRELADQGQLICSRTDMMAALKETFGTNATIMSTSVDSLRLIYTDRPGKSIPVVVAVKASAKAGYTIYGQPTAEPTRVTAYGPREIIDTITKVMTKSYVESDLSESRSFNSELKSIGGVRLIPSSVNVKVNVEPLVAKEDIVTVVAENVPQDENLLLFPSTVRVSYFVPMSEFSNEKKAVRVVVDYNDVAAHMGERIPLRIEHVNGVYAVNPRLHSDSVEYTLVR